MIEIAALDDEEIWIERERHISEIYFNNIGEAFHFFSYTDVERFMFEFEDTGYDIILMDMEMPDMNGLEVTKKIRRIRLDVPIIYVTNHIEYAPAAFEMNGFRYIPKRMLSEKLPLAYQAAIQLIQKQKKEYFMIQNQSGLTQILKSDIYYLRKEKKYVIVVHKEGEDKVRGSLNEIHQRLGERQFIRIDKSYVVNIEQIRSLKKRKLELQNDIFLEVSQPQLANVRQKIVEYWGEII